jgi:hypothetical protein
VRPALSNMHASAAESAKAMLPRIFRASMSRVPPISTAPRAACHW